MIAGNTGGQALSLIDDSFYIKITEVSGAAHGWVRVERNKAHLWDETSERASVSNDPAYEVNSGTGTVGQVYKAWRHATSGEVLFFLRSSNNIYPDCFVYFKGYQVFGTAFNNYQPQYVVTKTQPTGVVQVTEFMYLGDSGNEFTHGRLVYEYDRYAKRWRVWDIYHNYTSPGTTNQYFNRWAPDSKFGNSTYYEALPTWKAEGTIGKVNNSSSKYYYGRGVSASAATPGTSGPLIDCDVVKTCSSPPSFAAGDFSGETYTWKDSFPTCNITGHPRLSALQSFFTNTNYQQGAQLGGLKLNQAGNGTINVRIYNDNNGNFTWSNSTGTVVTESFLNMTINWSVLPVNSTVYSLTLDANFPPGPQNSPGIQFQKTGNLSIPSANQTTNGNVTVTFTPPANITASGTARVFTTSLNTPYPPHKIIKVTLINSSTVGSSPTGSNCPIAIQDANGTEFYIYRTSQTAATITPTVLGVMYWPIPSGYQSTPNPGSAYGWNQSHTRRIFDVTGNVTVSSNATGASYLFNINKTYEHGIDGYTSQQTTYTFTGNLTNRLAYQIGANTTVNLTTSYSGTVQQTVDLGQAKIEVIEV